MTSFSQSLTRIVGKLRLCISTLIAIAVNVVAGVLSFFVRTGHKGDAEKCAWPQSPRLRSMIISMKNPNYAALKSGRNKP